MWWKSWQGWMMKINKLFPHPLVSATFLISFIFYYFNSMPFFNDPDVGWHIKSGDLIRSLGSIPVYDSWSFIENPQKWYNISWLWDIAISFVNQAVGLDGLRIFYVVLYALSFGLLCQLLLKRKEFKEYAICSVMFINLFIMQEFVSLRPQIIAVFMAILFSYYLNKSRADEAVRKYLYIVLPALMVLWVNVHGSFLLAFIIGLVYTFEAYTNKQHDWLKFLLICGALCGVAVFINPYGFGIITAVLRTLHSVISIYITEWHPMLFSVGTGQTLALLVFLLVSNSRDEGISLSDKILAFLWLVAAMWSKRYFMFFAILGAPYLAYHLGKIGKPSPFPELDTAKLRRSFGLMALFSVALFSTPFMQSAMLFDKPILDEKTLPIKTTEYITQNLADKRFLNSYNIGGHLIYFGDGKIKIFTDGRAGTAYSEDVLADVILFTELSTGWEDIIKKYNIDAIVVDNHSTFYTAYEAGSYHDKWEKVFADENSGVFLPK
jgi:hypothetical protein